MPPSVRAEPPLDRATVATPIPASRRGHSTRLWVAVSRSAEQPGKFRSPVWRLS
jgi:hypothetical protein